MVLMPQPEPSSPRSTTTIGTRARWTRLAVKRDISFLLGKCGMERASLAHCVDHSKTSASSVGRIFCRKCYGASEDIGGGLRKYKMLRALFIALVVAGSGALTPAQVAAESTAAARHGMVVAQETRAARIGLDILQR